MNTPNLNFALIRILTDAREPRQPMGAGFLASPRHILTCAHVIADALQIRSDAPDPPAESVFLDFPLLDRHPPLIANVVKWYPVRQGALVGDIEDIAVLEVSGDFPLPGKARPVPIVMSDHHADRAVRMCGFPELMDDGDWRDGKCQGMIASGLVQIDFDPGQRSVAPGFSGSAVWDKHENAVSGMIVSISTRDEETSAYMIPGATLIRAFPDLDQHSRPPNPYRGLEAFREQDAPNYFGRAEVIQNLGKTVGKQPFVPVIGASGSGKSSLVFAGLVPSLRKTGLWLIGDFRPKNQPFHRLALALIPFLYKDKLEQAEQLKKMPGKLRSGIIGLTEIVPLILQEHPGKCLLLIADQFEELYTLNPDKDLQHAFTDMLLQATEISDFTLLLTMRADFMGQAIAYGPFAEALNTQPLKILAPMGESELREAIEGPARKSGVMLEPGLTDLILGELGNEPGNLPLLEFALTQLWEKQKFCQLAHDAYKEIGGVNKALARHADAVYAEFAPEDQERLRRIFVQLVHPGEGTEDTRQVATREQVKPENWNLIAQMADKRLVVTGRSEEKDVETVEVVHEALIRHWRPLQKWMREDRAFRTWQERLRERMREWEATGHDQGALLRGAPLAEAEEWLKEKEESLSAEDAKFIQASLKERKRTQRKRNFAIAAVFATAVFVAIVFVFLWKNTDKQRQLAEERRFEANYNLAKVFEEKAGLLLENAKHSDDFQKAWIFTLAALK